MKPCNGCRKNEIDDLLAYCCHRNPETGESKELELSDGSIVLACPNLSPRGLCTIYHLRPQPCRDYECHKFYEMDLFELLTLATRRKV